MLRPPPTSTLFPYMTLFRSQLIPIMTVMANSLGVTCAHCHEPAWESDAKPAKEDRKSTRLNSSHGYISYAVFCLKKKRQDQATGNADQHLLDDLDLAYWFDV